MAVRLRLRREGTKKKPHFRIVAADHRSPRDGRFIEIIGDYHPMANPSVVNVDEERALHWLSNGAKPSSQVENLLRITGVWEKFRPGDTAKPQHVEEAKPAKKDAAQAAEQKEAPEAAEATEQQAASAPSEDAAEAPEPEVPAPATDADETGGVEDTISDPEPETEAASGSADESEDTDESEEQA